MTVESRKRSLDEDEEEIDAIRSDFSDILGEEDEQEINVDQFLSQNVGLNDTRKRAKIEKKIRLTQQSQRLEPDTEESGVVAGVIKSVHLENFMCHENFELDFGPRLNFIIGHNGSGKSAILTAISICLGAKANETNRGSNLKDLIKEGKDYSIIKVVLVNEGIDVYESAKYGRTITIERRIRRDTASAPYLLKSETGKIVSTRKQDLDALLDFFTITVSNPMVFLSQDMARSFLTASTDDQKYKYFMKGTMMEEIIDNLKKSTEQLDRVNMKLLRMKDETSELKAEYTQAEELHQKLRDSNDLRTRQAHLYGKYFWFEVDEGARTIESVKESEVEYRENIAQIEEKIAEITAKIENHGNEVEKLKQKQEEIARQYSEVKDIVKEKEQLLNNAVYKAESVAHKLEEINTSLKKQQKNIYSQKQKIQKEEEKLRLSNGGSKELLQSQLESLKKKESDIGYQISGIRRELDEIGNTEKERHDEINNEINEKKAEYAGIDQQLKSIKNKNFNPLDGYPPVMKNLLREIQRAQFESRPIGPLGIEMRVKENFDKWSNLINSLLGGNSNAFIVQSFRDQRTLQSIMRKLNCNFPITVRRLERFNYADGLPSSQFTTVLDALSFKNEDVKFAMIDLIHIEAIVMIEDRHEAKRICESNIRNISSTVTFGTNSTGNQMSVNSNGAFRSNPIYYDFRNLPKIVLESGSQGAISSFEQSLNNLRAEIDALQNRRGDVTREFSGRKSELNKSLKDLNTELRRTTTSSYELSRKLEDDADSGVLEALQEELVDLEKQLVLDQNSIPDANDKIIETKNAAHAAQLERNAARQQFNDFRALRKEYEQRIDEADSNVEINENRRTHYIASKMKREKELEALVANIPTWEAKVRDNTEQALKHCTREQADAIRLRDIEAVKREIERVTAKVDEANQLLGKSPQEIVNDASIARGKFINAHEQFAEASESRKLLHQSIHDRMVSFRESRIMTCVSADVDFKDSLGFRNFSGNLEFDLEKKKLKMLVSTKNDKKPRHVDSLSGGEKSFSQIALLLATWKPMNSRIKGLDEFDVFMDQVNRKIGMRLMLSKLSANPKAQTIFITPQDIGQIAELDERYVRIHRVRDPRAGQQAAN